MIELGSIGWDDDEQIADFADRDDPDGVTLVRVQLTRGRDITQPLTSRAQGHKIVCQMRDGLFDLPPKDAACYVAIPDGMEACNGAGVIIATVSPGPERRRNVAPGNKFLSASEGEAGIIINKNGSITLHTTSDNTPDGASVFFRMSKDAFQFVAPFGRLIFDRSGLHCVTKSGARFDMGGISIPGLSDLLPTEAMANFSTYCTISAGLIKADCGSMHIGAGEIFNPALHSPVKSPPGAPPPLGVAAFSDCLQSQTLFVAP